MLVPPYFLTVVLIEAYLFDRMQRMDNKKVLDWDVLGKYFFTDFLCFVIFAVIIALILLNVFKQVQYGFISSL